MNKILLAFGFVAVAALVFFNLPKNPSPEIMLEKNTNQTVATLTSNNSRYREYSESSFDQASDKKRVYFFHAKWCPTCKSADEEFSQKIDTIPDDVMLFKTDYDSEKDLKTQYGITYQHTFVYVDSQGKELKKWNGGGLAELMNNTSR